MKKKINRKGFSLPLSMVFLLVTVMLSMVLISASLSALAQVKKNKDNTQASLTVTDTAAVLAKTIGGMEFQQNAEGNLTAINANGAPTEFVNYLIKNMQDAEKKNDSVLSELTTKESGTENVQANLIFYPMNSSDYPGDIVVSLKLAGGNDVNYNTTFRLDGWYDETEQVIKFGEPIFYSGSGVYQ